MTTPPWYKPLNQHEAEAGRPVVAAATTCTRFRVAISTGGMQFAGLTHHFLDLGDMLLLQHDLRAGVILQPYTFVNHELEQVVVLAKRGALVIQGFLENLNDVVLVGLRQLTDFQRRVAAKRCYVLAYHRSVAHALRGLVGHPDTRRHARVAQEHRRGSAYTQ